MSSWISVPGIIEEKSCVDIPRAVQDADNLDADIPRSIEDQVIAHRKLVEAQVFFPFCSHSWIFGEQFALLLEDVDVPDSGFRIILGDVITNVAQVAARQGREFQPTHC